MKKLENLLTLQLRPHMAGTLRNLINRMQDKMTPEKAAKLNESVLIRYLINATARNPMLDPAALRFALGQHIDPHSGEVGYRARLRKWMQPMVNLRVRLDPATLALLNAACDTATAMVPDYGKRVSQSRVVAGLIASAYYRDDVPKDDPDAEPIAKELIET